MDNRSHVFKTPEDLLKFITKEIINYIGISDTDSILFNYGRMTINELAQEVYIKILRSVNEGVNKSYVRQAVVYVCIDYYRLISDNDPVSPLDLEITEEEVYGPMERMTQMKLFTPKELKIIELLLTGFKNPEIREILKIPKMSYFTVLKRLRDKYSILDNLINLDT